MNAQQIVVLVFVLVLIGVGVWTFLGEDDDADGNGGSRGAAVEQRLRAEDRDPSTWSTAALPKVEPKREFETDSGVLVQVLEEGEGDAVQVGQAMDLRMQGYLLDGTVFDDGIMKHVIFGDRQRYVAGFQDGLEGMRPFERRRLLVPNELAYGAKSSQRIPGYADIVFDLRWIKLVITDLKEGTGEMARVGSKVTVRYRGTLEDGTVFDETKPGEPPATFTLKRRALIDGWVFGLADMKVGGERKLWVPAHLAYGQSRGPGGKLPPYANLIFVIELIAVE